MKDGHIIAEGAPEEVVTVERVYDVYGVTSRVYQDEELGTVMMPVSR